MSRLAIEPGVARPSQSLPQWLQRNVRQPLAAGDPERGGVEDPVRRPVEAQALPGQVLDHAPRRAQVLAHLPGRQPKQVAVALTVNPNGMPGREDLAHERGVALHLLADHEERRPRAGARQHLEHRRGAAGVRAVVEGERVTASARRAVLDSQGAPERRDDAAQRGRPIGGQHDRCKQAEAAMIVGGHG